MSVFIIIIISTLYYQYWPETIHKFHFHPEIQDNCTSINSYVVDGKLTAEDDRESI